VLPSWTSFHAGLTGAAVLLLALLGDRVTSSIGVGVAVVALLVVLGLNANYARALRQKPRSAARARGDRIVAVAVAAAIPIPLAYAAAAVYVDDLRVASSVLHDSSVRAFVACVVAAALASVFLSSATDWYAIRAWRDGVVTEPPCRRTGRGTWLNVTRWWLHHRIFATVGFFIGLWVVVDLGWFELAKRTQGSDWAYFLVGLISPALIPVILMRGYLTNLADAIGLAWGNLKLALGDTATWTDHGRRVTGIVYDVSIDGGYRVLEQDGSSLYLSLGDVRKDRGVEIDQHSPPPWACEAVCESAIEGACDFREVRDRPSPRGLII
jgi:hypothetical protein